MERKSGGGQLMENLIHCTFCTCTFPRSLTKTEIDDNLQLKLEYFCRAFNLHEPEIRTGLMEFPLCPDCLVKIQYISNLRKSMDDLEAKLVQERNSLAETLELHQGVNVHEDESLAGQNSFRVKLNQRLVHWSISRAVEPIAPIIKTEASEFPSQPLNENNDNDHEMTEDVKPPTIKPEVPGTSSKSAEAGYKDFEEASAYPFDKFVLGLKNRSNEYQYVKAGTFVFKLTRKIQGRSERHVFIKSENPKDIKVQPGKTHLIIPVTFKEDSYQKNPAEKARGACYNHVAVVVVELEKPCRLLYLDNRLTDPNYKVFQTIIASRLMSWLRSPKHLNLRFKMEVNKLGENQNYEDYYGPGLGLMGIPHGPSVLAAFVIREIITKPPNFEDWKTLEIPENWDRKLD